MPDHKPDDYFPLIVQPPDSRDVALELIRSMKCAVLPSVVMLREPTEQPEPMRMTSRGTIADMVWDAFPNEAVGNLDLLTIKGRVHKMKHFDPIDFKKRHGR
jgi:hypothetical protein